ncbi:hypothetical protein AVEN_45166-1 [Araneus ventricosus]|uniref:Uncharacterized protein n=1 Tax=Araneus ventricosus TaxID=182803 RepID=A0A4Y2JZL1_ARAVE|nr:hypothetical protein AVEN_45166-1 [Araneus ventricosus]
MKHLQPSAIFQQDAGPKMFEHFDGTEPPAGYPQKCIDLFNKNFVRVGRLKFSTQTRKFVKTAADSDNTKLSEKRKEAARLVAEAVSTRPFGQKKRQFRKGSRGGSGSPVPTDVAPSNCLAALSKAPPALPNGKEASFLRDEDNAKKMLRIARSQDAAETKSNKSSNYLNNYELFPGFKVSRATVGWN